MVIIWSRFSAMKICFALPGSWQYCKLFLNFIMWLHGKSFIPARWDPAVVLPGSRFSGTKVSHTIIRSRSSAMKNMVKSMYIAWILKINMMARASTTHLIRFKWNSKMVEDLIDFLRNYKAVCEYQSLDFNADMVKQHEEICK